MNIEYKEWIADIPLKDSFGKCKEQSNRMQMKFPELLIAKGFVILSNMKKYQHMWLKDEDGNVIDPTAKQYTGYAVHSYQEIGEDDPVPVGKCVNCGEFIMSNKSEYNPLCSSECYEDYATYLNSGGV